MSDYAASTPYRKVLVTMINLDLDGRGNKVAMVTDLRTNNEMSVPMSAPSRMAPQEGDVWQLTRAMGYWAFDSLIEKGPEKPISTLAQMYQRFIDLGVIEYRPELAGSASSLAAPVEVPHAAYVGEIRTFMNGTAPPGWLKTDGSNYNRVRYRDLYNYIGTTYGVGDGDATFTIPNISPLVLDPRVSKYKTWDMPWGLLDSTGFFSFSNTGLGGAIITGADRIVSTTRAGRIIQADFNTSDHFGDTVGDVIQTDFTMDSTTFLAANNIQVPGGNATSAFGTLSNVYVPPGLIRRFYTTTTTSHRFRTLFQRLSGSGIWFHRGYVAIYDIGQNGSPPSTNVAWSYICAGVL